MSLSRGKVLSALLLASTALASPTQAQVAQRAGEPLEARVALGHRDQPLQEVRTEQEQQRRPEIDG